MKRRILALAALVLVATLVRLHAARVVGFGDSEALYACYALHPQAAYLDHPGLVGVVMAELGGGGAPSPTTVHTLTTVLLALSIPLAVLVARASRASEGAALGVGFVLFAVPELAIGLFGLTPDALLFPTTLLFLLFATLALRPEDDARRPVWFLLAGLSAGVAASAKVTGILLLVVLAVASARTARARTPWPWLGILLGGIVVSPVVLYEIRHGFPMASHRLVSTQADGGFSLRNVLAFAGGQLAYVSPVFAILAVAAARRLWRARNADPQARLLFLSFAIQAPVLGFLALWSRVAEPHWFAPALLALPFAEARAPGPLTRRLAHAGFGVALGLTALVHAWVLVPASAALVPAGVDPKVDIANELYGWNQALAHARDVLASDRGPGDPDGSGIAVVGPHWTVCAQLHAGLGRGVAVGCDTPIRDDFDGWLPRHAWRARETILWVSDNRFATAPAPSLPGHSRTLESRVRVMRGGRTARIFTFTVFERRAQALWP